MSSLPAARPPVNLSVVRPDCPTCHGESHLPDPFGGTIPCPCCLPGESSRPTEAVSVIRDAYASLCAGRVEEAEGLLAAFLLELDQEAP